MSNAQPAVTFDEIRALMRNLPGPDLEAGTAALERQPESAEAYRGIGLPQRKLGDTGGAITAFRNYLKLAPEAADRIEIEGWIEKQTTK